ncbi:MAG: RNA polymerase sigma factor [Bradyrhizobiaceae bacterium]|nr:RNA polymerase sigma factor [Bradyrhizobiaceae bacterium]
MHTTDHEQHSERFLKLYMPLQDSLWRFVRSLVRSEAQAEDVVSETVLQAFEGFSRIRDEQAFLSYLFTIASRIVQKQRWRSRWFDEFDEDQVAMMHSSETQPDVRADVVLLREALTQLPEATRQAVVLFEINGFSLEEIRQIQGGSLSGVKSRVVRGRRMLSVLLGCETEHKQAVHSMSSRSTDIPTVPEPSVVTSI